MSLRRSLSLSLTLFAGVLPSLLWAQSAPAPAPAAERTAGSARKPDEKAPRPAPTKRRRRRLRAKMGRQQPVCSAGGSGKEGQQRRQSQRHLPPKRAASASKRRPATACSASPRACSSKASARSPTRLRPAAASAAYDWESLDENFLQRIIKATENRRFRSLPRVCPAATPIVRTAPCVSACS